MRVTKETREKTRLAILAATRAQFEAAGYEATKTRSIATEAGIAVGTLFNYFPTKEALGLALVEEATTTAEIEFEANRREGESLEEKLFAFVATQLRHLAPTRSWIASVLDTALSPLRVESADSLAGEFRRHHLERVSDWLATGAGPRSSSSDRTVDLHLYWSLYLGVVGFWANDESHNQENTLALLDRSIGLFCNALRDE